VTVVATITSEGIAARADLRFTGDQVVAVLEGLAATPAAAPGRDHGACGTPTTRRTAPTAATPARR
jgi:hypothetical protein